MSPAGPIDWLRERAPWLFAPGHGTCLVGSQALAVACDRTGVAGPHPADLDLAWLHDTQRGTELLVQHGVHLATTEGNVERGTLAMKLDGRRIEVTTLRAGRPEQGLHERIHADLAARDMTIGALAVELATGRVHDPLHGIEHWQARRIVPVGDAAERVREHAVRWVRYYRKAHQLGFELDRAVRKLALPPDLLLEVPAEAVAAELRAGLLHCASPGRLLLELHEADLLETIAPELAPQFDGRPAGPQRHHPEVSQALHLVLALEWSAARSHGLDERDRSALLLAVLCHDLGKGLTAHADFPRHLGHEGSGLRPIRELFERLPGLGDQRSRSLALAVCELHLVVRDFGSLRSGTLAELYDRHFRAKDFPVALFALAIGADVGGRLGREAEGETVAAAVQANLELLRSAGGSVDAAALRSQHAEVEDFRRALHEARSRAIKPLRWR